MKRFIARVGKIALRISLCALLVGLNNLCASIGRAGDDFTFFETRIRPVLVEHCYKCHSAGAEKLKGSLFLDSKPGILGGGESGAAVIPGDVEKSLLIRAIRYTDKDLQMPPEKAGGKLTAAQIADFETWVKMGAPDPRTELLQNQKSKTAASSSPYDYVTARTNWAFQPPKMPMVPKIKNSKWTKSPIDNFILSKLEAKKIAPARAADKRTLLRRASFDLIGLPPTEKEMTDFLADKSTNAFAKVVDRLLASPHYGERWARHWLDVVRYTDSLDARIVGTEQDCLDAWRYRDWVVNAFNSDLPYDQFITQQIAGDLLPPPEPNGIDTNAIIATGVYAIGNWGNGDADKEKILTDIADDAVDVTGRAFLGLTLACARCHDHKFDPVSTADYYSMAGIFFSSHILDKLAPKGAGETLMRIPLASKSEMENRKKREVRIAELQKEIGKIADDEIETLAAKSISQTARYLIAAGEYKIQTNQNISAFATENNLQEIIFRRWLDFLESGHLGLFPNPIKDLSGNLGLLAWKNSKAEDTPAAIFNSSDKELAKIPARRFAVHPAPKTGVTVAWKSPVNGVVKISGRVADADPGCGDGVDWTLTKNAKQLVGGAIANGSLQGFGDEKELQKVEVVAGERVQLTIFPKGDHVCDTTLVDFHIAELNGAKRAWDVVDDVGVNFLQTNPLPDRFGNSAVWHFIDLANAPKGLGASNSLLTKFVDAVRVRDSVFPKIADEIQRALETKSNPDLREELAGARSVFWSPLRNEEKILSAPTTESISRLKVELSELQTKPLPPVIFAHGLQDGGTPESPHAGVHDVKIHVRGRYDRLGEIAPRKFPLILAGDKQPAITNGSGRLQLAKWLTSAENPLTARVMVNRIWQHHFGEGIVRTPNNFGKLGEPPTHPELLDFLANEFIDSGWSMKAMHRAIMLAAVYQQASANIDGAKADPENKLLGRMNRRRLESEALRDSLLSAANQMDLTMGGPSIRDLNTNRRTLYVTTIRSDRATYQFLFDAADPNAIVDKRLDSIVSPQALFLLNHPFVMAQTKILAERVIHQARADEREKIQWLYENLYGRPARSREIEIGLKTLAAARASEKRKVNVDQLAWEQYCQVLLCANEFIYLD